MSLPADMHFLQTCIGLWIVQVAGRFSPNTMGKPFITRVGLTVNLLRQQHRGATAQGWSWEDLVTVYGGHKAGYVSSQVDASMNVKVRSISRTDSCSRSV